MDWQFLHIGTLLFTCKIEIREVKIIIRVFSLKAAAAGVYLPFLIARSVFNFSVLKLGGTTAFCW